MREAERAWVLQAGRNHPVHADVGGPDQTDRAEQSIVEGQSPEEQQEGEHVAMDGVVDRACPGTRPLQEEQQAEVRNEEQARKQDPAVRKEDVVGHAGDQKQAHGFRL